MLERRDPEPAFFAPFVSSPMRVDPAWIDYNGHLNMAYYNVLFDRAVDEVYELLGCGLDYLKEKQHSCYTAEVHLRYLRELRAGDLVRVTFQLLDFDLKRLHYFEELHHAEEGWLSATSENMEPRTQPCRCPRPPAGALPCRGSDDSLVKAASRCHLLCVRITQRQRRKSLDLG